MRAVCCCWMSLAVAGCAGKKDKANMVDYEVSPESTEYLAGQEVTIRVRLANRGPAAIHIPDPEHEASHQPVHTLQGPGLGSGSKFTGKRSIRAQEEAAPSVDIPPITIEPGAAWEVVMPINSIVDVGMEGEYNLTSELHLPGINAQSRATTFRVRPGQPGSIHAGIGASPLGIAEGEAAFIENGAVYALAFRETRSAIGEASIDRPIRRANAGRDATDIGVPWREGPFFNEMLKWLIWREGRDLKALSDVMSEPFSMAFPGDLSRLVRPPLKTTGSPVDVLALSKDEKTLHLARVGAQRGEEPRGTIAWSYPLPADPGAITAALGPADERHIAFLTANRSGDLAVLHTHYKGASAPGPLERVSVDGAGNVPDGFSIGMKVDARGAATVGVVAVSEDKRTCTLVEVTFGSDGKASSPKLTRTEELADAVVDAAVIYPPQVPAQVVVVVRLKNNRVLKLGDDGKFIEAPVQGTPTQPLILAPGKQTTYILYTDPKRGFYLESLL